MRVVRKSGEIILIRVNVAQLGIAKPLFLRVCNKAFHTKHLINAVKNCATALTVNTQCREVLKTESGL
jgi:hypothetical protein